MSYWERTWRERNDEISRAFGDTEPPGMVCSFSWDDGIRCPGACALTFPPTEARRDPIRTERLDWLYLSMGLSQPLERPEETEQPARQDWSGFGCEIAIITPQQSTWVNNALYHWMTLFTGDEGTGNGHRFPFGFYVRKDGSLDSYIGYAANLGFTPFGEIRGALHWPLLFPQRSFVTSTGKFMLLASVGITEDEWDFAKQTTSTHLQLLLCRAGICQRTIPDRLSVLKSPPSSLDARQVESMTEDECKKELDAGIGRWHLMPLGA